MPRRFGELVFTLTDVRIAAYNILTDTYGTPVIVHEPQTFEVTPEGDTDMIKATGYITHLGSWVTHYSFKLSSAGIPFDALAVLTYGTTNSSPSTQISHKHGGGGRGMPYFGIVGKLLGEQADDLHVGLAVCKLDKPPAWKAEQNKFVLGECNGKGIVRASSGVALYLLGHETATAIDFGTIFA